MQSPTERQAPQENNATPASSAAKNNLFQAPALRLRQTRPDHKDVAPLPPAKLTIITYNGEDQQTTTRELTSQASRIGSDPANDVVIAMPDMPRNYAVIRRDPGADPRIILAKGVTLPLYFQGQRVTEHTLTPGDILCIGAADGAPVTLIYDGEPQAQEAALNTGQRHIQLAANQAIAIGSAIDNQIVFDDPLVAPHHAQIAPDSNGVYTITDLDSPEGTLVNGEPVKQTELKPGAEICVGPYGLVFTGQELVERDLAKEIQIAAIDLRRSVGVGFLFWRKRRTLLDDISLSIPPGSFVALVGGSGTGKTTLLNALSGQQPPQHGEVLYNGQNLYEHLEAYSQMLGYVPQDDIIHKSLTVERALVYAAKLRLPGLTRQQLRARINAVLSDIEMTKQRQQVIARLSGGQRKRVSIGVELLSNPPVFFLDEPTSGLDLGLDRKIMQLLRRLANRGHTIVLATHTTNNLNLCDYVAFLAPGGRLAYYGPPELIKQHFQMPDYAEIYNALYHDPDRWVAAFQASPEYQHYVVAPRERAEEEARQVATTRAAPPEIRPINRLRQFSLLTARYLELFARDRINLFILLIQAPVIALLIMWLSKHDAFRNLATDPGMHDYAQRTLFIMVCSAVWFGTINAVREIVKENAIYRRERSLYLDLRAYVLSKILVLGFLCLVQSAVLLAIVGYRTNYPANGVFLKGVNGAFVEMFVTLWLISFVGLMLGLLISAIAPNSDRAVSFVIIVLIPQIIFANVIFSLGGVSDVLSWLMPSRWGMQALGSLIGLKDAYTDHGSPFYTPDHLHIATFALALVAQALVFFCLTLTFLQRKDVAR